MLYNYFMANKFSDTMLAFSKQFSKFKNSGREEPVKSETPNHKLQKQIDNFESDRKTRIERQYDSYKNPVSQQIEGDEENLIKAYNLFKGALDLNSASGDERTHLESLRVASPLTQKSEYITGSAFCFLRLWFLEAHADATHVPVVAKHNENYFIEFIPKDEYQFTSMEKEIMQITATCAL